MAPLLARSVAADRGFERLYRRHAHDVYRYAFAVLRNQADAEDVTQTTFLNAYRALERGEEPQAPQNWLISIAHNVCRQRFRQQSRRVQEVGLDLDVADGLVAAEDDDAPTPEDITRALGHLAFNQRAALVMRELEGRSYAEIAELLGLTVSAVETLIFRARRALREQLEGSLTCGQAEHFLSMQLDGELGRGDRSQLRAHLRECASCRKLARSQRAHRKALQALGAVPLPSSLASLFGGGGAAAVASKVAAVVVASTVAAGGIGLGTHELLQPKTKARHHVVVPTMPTRPLPTTPIAGVAVATRPRGKKKTTTVATHAAPVVQAPTRTVARPVHRPQPQPQPQPEPAAPPEQREPEEGTPAPPRPTTPEPASPSPPTDTPASEQPDEPRAAEPPGNDPQPAVTVPAVTLPVPPLPVPPLPGPPLPVPPLPGPPLPVDLPPVQTPPITVPIPSPDDVTKRLPDLGGH
jgi:RNA polymerase sigma factor (sigma-70 family)